MAEQMTWTNEPIERLPQFSPYLKNFNALVKHEGGPANVFPDAMRCIDLDAYEKGLKKGIHNPTVDAVIGVFSGKISELVLVELRLNYKNADNLSPTKLEEKMSCSKDILSGCGKLHPIVLFSCSTIACNRRHAVGLREQNGVERSTSKQSQFQN